MSERDQLRTERLAALGFRVIRYWNHEVLGQIDVVVGQIGAVVLNTPTLALPHRGREGR